MLGMSRQPRFADCNGAVTGFIESRKETTEASRLRAGDQSEIAAVIPCTRHAVFDELRVHEWSDDALEPAMTCNRTGRAAAGHGRAEQHDAPGSCGPDLLKIPAQHDAAETVADEVNL